MSLFVNTKTELEKHTKDHHTRPCIACELEFKTISEWKEHMKKSHGPECTIRSKYFDKQDELEKHVAEKIRVNPKTNTHVMCVKSHLNLLKN